MKDDTGNSQTQKAHIFNQAYRLFSEGKDSIRRGN